MPYMVAKEGEKYCVYKKGPDGKPMGPRLGTHDTEEEANKQIAAIHANEGVAAESKPTELIVVKEKENKPRTSYFAELSTLQEAEFDTEKRRVKVTLIRPGWSDNNRYYAPDVLKKAAGLFEGAQAYFDHPSKAELKERPERSVRDLAGWYEGVAVEPDGRITGYLNLIAEDALPLIKAAAERNPKLAGLSINAIGTTRQGEVEGKKGIIVEAITKAHSTDIVTVPAAGGRFEALTASTGDTLIHDLLAAMGLDELQETLRGIRPDLVKAWRKEWQTPRDTKALDTARAEAEKQKTKIAELEKENRARGEKLAEAEKKIAALEKSALVDRLLEGSGLPRKWRETLRGQLVAAKPDEMKSIIEAERVKAAAIKPSTTVRGAGAVAPVHAQRVRLNPVAESLGINPAWIEVADYNEFVRLRKGII